MPFTSNLAEQLAPDLLDRFLRYVRIDTQADEKSETYPSSPGQLVLGALLRDELLAMGLSDARQDEHGLVFAAIPGNVAGAPTIGPLSTRSLTTRCGN